jgi:hypothetical protein
LRNFISGLATAEIAVACRTIGLDPGMGIGLHHDVRGRELSPSLTSAVGKWETTVAQASIRK